LLLLLTHGFCWRKELNRFLACATPRSFHGRVSNKRSGFSHPSPTFFMNSVRHRHEAQLSFNPPDSRLNTLCLNHFLLSSNGLIASGVPFPPQVPLETYLRLNLESGCRSHLFVAGFTIASPAPFSSPLKPLHLPASASALSPFSPVLYLQVPVTPLCLVNTFTSCFYANR